MHPAFQQFADSLQPSFERLLASEPFTVTTIPPGCAKQGIYLFSEGDLHLYVGRTRQFIKRMAQHSRPGSQHNQAVFAFRLAREQTGRLKPSYGGVWTRVGLSLDEEFSNAFTAAKVRVRNMDLRFVEESDPLRQALLEIYVSVVLNTPYNDFNTH
jgi:hypothetical protein